MMRVGRPGAAGGAAVAFVLVVSALAYARIFFGVDFTDEAWYVANSHRYVLGDRPYVDERNVTQQTASILLYPFTLAWDALFGREGIVLYFRHLYFLFSATLVAASWLYLRRALGPRPYLLLVAALPVAFLPFAIPSVSYNTLASGAFLAGALGVFAVSVRPSPALAAGAAGLHAIAVFAYPPFLLPVALQLALVGPGWRRHRAVLAAAAAPLLLAGLGLLTVFLWAGVETVRTAIAESSEFLGHAGGWAKFQDVVLADEDRFPARFLAVGFLLAAWALRSRVPVVAAALLALLVVTALPELGTGLTVPVELVRNYGFLAIGLYPFVRGRPLARPLLLRVWVPAMAAGLTVSYSSANGVLNFGLGSVPAAVVTLVFAAWALEDVARRAGAGVGAPAVAAALVVGLLSALQWGEAYRDGPIAQMGERVEQGPYRGLLTTPAKRDYLDEVVAVVDPLVGPGSTVLFYDEFPAGYLLTEARPNTSYVWLHAGVVGREGVAGYREILFRHFRRVGTPDVVVHVLRGPLHGASAIEVRYRRGDPLVAWVEAEYEQAGGDDVVAYVRR
jgi:hypothetical protein